MQESAITTLGNPDFRIEVVEPTPHPASAALLSPGNLHTLGGTISTREYVLLSPRRPEFRHRVPRSGYAAKTVDVTQMPCLTNGRTWNFPSLCSFAHQELLSVTPSPSASPSACYFFCTRPWEWRSQRRVESHSRPVPNLPRPGLETTSIIRVGRISTFHDGSWPTRSKFLIRSTPRFQIRVTSSRPLGLPPSRPTSSTSQPARFKRQYRSQRRPRFPAAGSLWAVLSFAA